MKLHLEDIRTIFDLHLGKRVRPTLGPKMPGPKTWGKLTLPTFGNQKGWSKKSGSQLAIFVNPRGPYFLVGKWISYEVVQDSSLIKSSVQNRMSPRRLVSFGAFTTVDEILSEAGRKGSRLRRLVYKMFDLLDDLYHICI